MTVSEKLKTLRKERKITQEQLAKILGVERSSVGKYETGTLPSMEILTRIATYFGVSVDYLLGREDTPSNKTEHTPTDDDIKVALFGGDGEVTDEMWDEVKRFAEFVKSKQKKGEK